MENAFLGTIHSTNSHTTEWLVELYLNEVPVTFKIDTGAKVTAIPEAIAAPFKATMTKPSHTLLGPGMNSLNVCGQFMGTLQRNSDKVKEEIFVVKDLHVPLVGFPAINALNLVAKVCDMTISKETVLIRFPQLFSGLGQLQGEYDIKLNSDAIPFDLSTPRRIPLPLMDQVKAELTRMENQQIISKVEGPTDWPSGMVVVPKPNK